VVSAKVLEEVLKNKEFRFIFSSTNCSNQLCPTRGRRFCVAQCRFSLYKWPIYVVVLYNVFTPTRNAVDLKHA